ncbi:serine/threonine-protein kinase HAL4/sat4, partial [Ascosphaera pollenicola]
MDVLNDPFAPKAPPKRTKTGALHHFNTLKASGVISLVLLAIDAVIIGQYLARYSGLTLDICLSGHPKEDKICETYVFEILGVTVVGLFFALLAGATVQGYSSERMDRVLQSVG